MRIKLKNAIKVHLLLIFFLSFYFIVISFKLITHPTPFYDWDESINVQVSKETIANKSFVPLWQGNAWLDKPPLPFLFFGIIMKLTPFLQPEISLRLTSLFLSLIALIFIYFIYLKVANETSEVKEERSDGKTSEVKKIIATLTVITTAFTPIFLQRSQILNLDVFLLIGWLGYLLFVQNFWLSLFFLAVGVLTKSLLGFYPAIIILGFNFFLLFKPPRLRSEAGLPIVALAKMGEPRRLIRMVFIQIGILSLRYLVMLLLFKQNFWQQHIIETHFRRVTASLESHFGQRTYYLDLISEQLGIFFWFSILGLFFVILSGAKNLSIYLRKSRIRERSFTFVQDDKLLYSLFLLPWFIFLNLTKTKIFWYLYPAIPQFAFLSVYPLTLLSFPHVSLSFPRLVPRSPKDEVGKRESSSLFNRFRIKSGMTLVAGLLIVAYIFYQNFIKTNFFATFYSKPEDYYQLALYAKDHCDSLSVLVGKETREATSTLEKMGLTITSTKQWGDHPSIVYYFAKKVDFYYDKNILVKKLSSLSRNNCLVIRKADSDINIENKEFKQVKNFDSYYLFKR